MRCAPGISATAMAGSMGTKSGWSGVLAGLALSGVLRSVAVEDGGAATATHEATPAEI